MKKILFIATLTGLFVIPIVGLAVTTLPPGPQTEADIIAIFDRIANWIFAIFLAVAVIFILIAAYQFLTSGGDPARVSSARQSLLYALVGIAIAFVAKGLITLVKTIVGV